ncbi:ganglioside-induced differentiation-associated protein 1-like [Paramacrobiotus metropolitanus]|uniref:ganglioside-induced differentiation-associated protein 1-like n=1 Tax=Paramacrobiotus metropolitanus TaxID=2943436 RepID=UPI0024459BB5|nr:ganglioside-induced differentiation-associated protein 1-like [Paramacrobiotus metropolitanus]
MSKTMNGASAKPQIVLYYYPLSFYSQKVRMALLEKGIPHSLEFIDISCGENYEPWFVKINPACEVPVLRDGTKIISGSQRIIDYLEEHYTTGFVSLSPGRSSIEFHKVRYLRDAIDAVPIELITYGYMRHSELTDKIKVPDFVKSKLGERFFQRKKLLSTYMAKHPELRDAYNDKLARVEQNDSQADDLNAVNGKLNEVDLLLDKIEEHLRTNATVDERRNWWLCAAEFTTADISLAILLSRLYFLGLAQRFWSISTRPYLAIYYQRLNDRPAFQKVAVTHVTTSDLVKYGGASLLYAHGLTFLGIATVVGVIAIGAFIVMRRRK